MPLSQFPQGTRELFEPAGALVRTSMGSEVANRAQAAMAQAVAQAIEDHGILAIEAGTGVGKTWAYLAPLLIGGKKAWLSTATQALQDQLFQRDIPALSQALGLPVRAALLKGRSNYVCVQRVDLAQAGGLPAMAADPGWVPVLERVRQWAAASSAGDLAELPGLDESSPLRPWISSTRENCWRDACPRLNDCHVFRARRLAQEADWVVINHHLYLAGEFGPDPDALGLLPNTDVVVFDEAHRLVALGESQLGLSLGSQELRELARDVQTLGTLWAKGMQPWAHHALMLSQASQTVARLTGGHSALAGQATWDAQGPQGWPAKAWQAARLTVYQALHGASLALASVADASAPLAQLAHRAKRLCDAWQALVQDTAAGAESSPRWVRWVEWGAEGAWRVARSAPDFAQAFQRAMALPDGPKSWVFTSATLGTDNALTWFTSGLGLAGHPKLRTVCISSPFDHARQASLFVPETLPEPADPHHSEALAALVAGWATVLGGRTLVLTTSLRASARIAEGLRETLAHRPGSALQVLAQGQLSKRAMLARFRAAGASGAGAVMVASASFWEGVDLPGDVLQLLVIDKLPFPSPGDPLTQVRAERARQKGLDVFETCYVESAAMALKQGAGRLIRSASDRGILVVADRRLVTQSYGNRLLAALPAMPRLMDAAQMQAALSQLVLHAHHSFHQVEEPLGAAVVPSG